MPWWYNNTEYNIFICSTALCTTLIKEVASKFVTEGSNVYCWMNPRLLIKSVTRICFKYFWTETWIPSTSGAWFTCISTSLLGSSVYSDKWCPTRRSPFAHFILLICWPASVSLTKQSEGLPHNSVTVLLCTNNIMIINILCLLIYLKLTWILMTDNYSFSHEQIIIYKNLELNLILFNEILWSHKHYGYCKTRKNHI